MIKKILIIWEIVPENTKFYLMSFDMTTAQAHQDLNDQVKELMLVHGRYLNQIYSVTEAQKLLIDGALETLSGIFEHKLPDWMKELNLVELISCQPDFIFHTGIIA